jgi:alpha-L-fucosidase 2
MEWKDGKLTGATVKSLLGNPCKVRYGAQSIELTGKAGERWMIGPTLARK